MQASSSAKQKPLHAQLLTQSNQPGLRPHQHAHLALPPHLAGLSHGRAARLPNTPGSVNGQQVPRKAPTIQLTGNTKESTFQSSDK
jgi:hypothetical protein